MNEVLVLNSGFIPVRTVSIQESMCLLYTGKAYPVVEEDRYMRSPSMSIRIPSVLALIGYHEFPRRKVGFSKLNVIYRDEQICQYCGKRYNINELTVDHIIPRSRWRQESKDIAKGATNWTNLVCACKWCNRGKGDRLLRELGWKLIREPYEPEYLPHIVVTYDKANKKGWLPFCKFNVRIIHTL